MENLNDAEFGSDKSTEEAPILVAQRYLNIFRQIHIFNKEMRQQFDDELLALPQNIADFFKKMPGGRLLVEHIEDVKTERGISFVKSNKEDFTNGADAAPTPTATDATATPVPVQVSTGAITVDSSFAETLATSLAGALNYSNTPIQTQNSVAPSGDFFKLISEEMNASRNSLTELLKEVRSITDSVVASQILLSKTLSQLPTSSATNCNTDIDYKLHQFRSEINMELEKIANLVKMQSGIPSSVSEQEQLGKLNQSSSFVDEHDIVEKEDIQHTQQDSETTAKKKKKKKKNKNNTPSFVENNAIIATLNEPSSYQSLESSIDEDTPFEDDFHPSDIEQSIEELAPELGSIVKDIANKSVDNFDGIQFDTPFSNIDLSKDDFTISNTDIEGLTHSEEDFNNEHQTINDVNYDNTSSEISELDSGLDNLLTELSSSDEQPEINTNDTDLSSSIDELDELASHSDSNFSFSEQKFSEIVSNKETQTSINNEEVDGLDALVSEDGLDFALPEQSEDDLSEEETNTSINTEEISGLDALVADDDLDFALPEQSEDDLSEEEVNTSINTEEISELDAFVADDGLDFALPEQSEKETLDDEANSSIDNEEISGLDAFVADDDLDFALPEQSEDETLDDETDSSIDNEEISGLDAFVADDETITVDTSSLVDISSDAIVEEERTTSSTPTQSRFSAELDRIREALTADNIDISSLDNPIALDDYSDDENVIEDDFSDLEATTLQFGDNSLSENALEAQPNSNSDDEDWEWEYVDEDGNPISPSDDMTDEDWEWEYVEDDGSDSQTDNNNK